MPRPALEDIAADEHQFVTVLALVIALVFGSIALCVFDIGHADRARNAEIERVKRREYVRRDLGL